MNDSIADLLTKIRNVQAISGKEVVLPASKMRLALLEILKKEGYIDDYIPESDGVFKRVKVILRYTEKGSPAIREITRVSKPGRRVFQGYKELKSIKGGLGKTIISTSEGLMTNRAARGKKLGGEVICEIF